MNLLQKYTANKLSQVKSDIKSFKSGDMINVEFKIFDETGAHRLQSFQGVVIYKTNQGLTSSVLVRKMFKSYGVERLFKIHSPMINQIEIVKKVIGKTIRRARIYYFSKLTGKKAKIKDKFTT